MNRFKALDIPRLDAGMHCDGAGLYIRVSATGARSWVFRYRRNGKLKDIGLGGFPEISLAIARQRAAEHRGTLASGVDPAEARKAATEPAKSLTFAAAAERYIKAHEKGWRNPKTAIRWRSTIRDYAAPVIGKKDVRDITASDIETVLAPIWLRKRDSAFKLRGSIENILAWCAVKGFRDPAKVNPAMWRGNLKHMLPPQKRAENIVSHPAMPYADVPGFYARLKVRGTMSAVALRFIMLTVCRASEGLLMTREEVSAGVWKLTRERVKEYRNREIPLVPEALAIIEDRTVLAGNPYVFFGIKPGRPLSLQSIDNLLERMAPGYTTHGFRSAFKDWAREKTRIPDEISELCLGHKVGSEVRLAYARSTLLAKRRALLTLWCKFLNSV